MKMHCPRLQSHAVTERNLHNQDCMTKGIPVYTSDSGIGSHYRAFLQFCRFSIGKSNSSQGGQS